MNLATLCYIENEKSEILMMHRVKKVNDMHKDKWNAPGGKFESKESPEECVIREVKEETGLDITSPRMAGILTFNNFDGSTWYVFVYHVTQFTGELLENKDVAEGNLKWVKRDDLLSLPLHEGDLIFIPWVLEKKDQVFSAKFVYNPDGSLNTHKVVFY